MKSRVYIIHFEQFKGLGGGELREKSGKIRGKCKKESKDGKEGIHLYPLVLAHTGN